MAEHGPSEKAVQAALDSLKESSNLSVGIGNKDDAACGLAAFDALAAAHDPALGLDRSACLADVVGVLREMGYAEHKIAYVVRAFTESSSPRFAFPRLPMSDGGNDPAACGACAAGEAWYGWAEWQPDPRTVAAVVEALREWAEGQRALWRHQQCHAASELSANYAEGYADAMEEVLRFKPSAPGGTDGH